MGSIRFADLFCSLVTKFVGLLLSKVRNFEHQYLSRLGVIPEKPEGWRKRKKTPSPPPPLIGLSMSRQNKKRFFKVTIPP